MRLLVVGASGFIGRRAVTELLSGGHQIVVCGTDLRRLRLMFPSLEAVPCNFAKDGTADWLPRLAGVDGVINAAGIWRGRGSNSLEAIHVTGPGALFEACAQLRIARLVQISALGADSGAKSAFHLTKRRADENCLRLASQHGLGWAVVRPSLVIGRGGRSTALFCALGALPLPPRLGHGQWKVQPIHVSDLACAVRLLLEQPLAPARELDIVGPRSMTTDQLTHVLRRWLVLPPAGSLPTPIWLLRGAALLFSPVSGGSILSGDALDMLERGNVAPIAPLKGALRWEPRPLAEALSSEPSTQADLWQARLFFLRPLLRIGLASVWLFTAFVSAFVHPLEKSVAMVAGLGFADGPAEALVYGGAALDAVLGLALLFDFKPALVGIIQIATVLLFTALATAAIPQAWLDPLGPLTKNLPVILATLVMVALERR